jgi:hypothetical protein
MSLNYDITKCKGVTDDDRKDYLWPICSVMMALGIDELTPDKKLEFAHRIKLFESVKGFFYSIEKDGRQESAFTEELLNRFEGITTNVSFETFPRFSKRLLTREKQPA